ncbi:PAS domain S-box protein [Chondromyces apiculatus]|uniref:RsbR, positive regulator of sigma-B n=1 Tax=Chondromyces apiculatus DSM 436 TaxID=1192034 RepID=A0A017SYK9_9BACT|nr:PAS domain S-box protein [Chondromyces apiculatus]EYF01396.1 Hypothetical protein CAP_8327 [Chondromyces apiculatus DSM 436]
MLPSNDDRDDVIRGLEEELQHAQRKLALLYRQAPVGVIEWDGNFKVTEWNATTERIFGYSRDEALGKFGPELVVGEDLKPHIQTYWDSIVAQRLTTSTVNENIRKDGRVIVCEWHNAVLADSDGRIIGVTSLVFDVTERHQAEQALRQRERAQAATIDQLSTPVLDLWQGIVAVPILGALDTGRAARMTEAVLAAIVDRTAAYTILDLTGAESLDASIAGHLGQLVRAVRLLGATCLVSGMGPGLARLLTEHGVALEVQSFGTLRAALAFALTAARSGAQVGRRG